MRCVAVLLVWVGAVGGLPAVAQTPAPDTAAQDAPAPVLPCDEEKARPWPRLVGSMEDLRAHLRYSRAMEAEMTGQVVVGFEVDETGHPDSLHVLRSLHLLFDAEAVRIVREHARFVPTCRGGRPVRARGALPISFNIY